MFAIGEAFAVFGGLGGFLGGRRRAPSPLVRLTQNVYERIYQDAKQEAAQKMDKLLTCCGDFRCYRGCY